MPQRSHFWVRRQISIAFQDEKLKNTHRKPWGMRFDPWALHYELVDMIDLRGEKAAVLHICHVYIF